LREEKMANPFETKLLTAVKTGIIKARELGYPVEKMKLSTWVENNHCFVYFEPQPEPDTIVTGGDLTVKIDFDRNHIVEILRGQ
jgi:hypothetical protein